jgi:histone-lysine N-methyltransferase SETMAR
MITIVCVWNPTRFHVIRVLPKGHKFDSSYYQSKMLEPLSEWRSGQAGAAGGTLIIHANNARPHTAAAVSQQFMEENVMERAPHPLYSPDLAPSDFCLFGYTKHCLRERSFGAADDLFSAIDGY